jgi:hypothetical protein
MAYVQHTHCVKDYTPLAPGVVAAAVIAVAGILGGGPIGAIAALIGGYWALSQVCDYLLGGKLICLKHDLCAIGRVMELEPPGYHKSGFETIDNDYSVNIILSPHHPGESDEDIQEDGLQGHLIKEQFESSSQGVDFQVYHTSLDIWPVNNVPVLHLEFEGSRIYDF